MTVTILALSARGHTAKAIARRLTMDLAEVERELRAAERPVTLHDVRVAEAEARRTTVEVALADYGSVKWAAKAIGVPATRLRAWMQRLGISPAWDRGAKKMPVGLRAKQIEARHPGLIEAIRTRPPREIAAQFKISRQYVYDVRDALGIATPRWSRVRPKAVLPDAAIPLLGAVSDRKIAARFGVPLLAVWRARNERGIAAYDSSTVASWRARLAEWEPLLGEVPDLEIARRFCVDQPRVSAHRARLGISCAPLRTWRSVGRPACDVGPARDLLRTGSSYEDAAATVGVSAGYLRRRVPRKSLGTGDAEQE